MTQPQPSTWEVVWHKHDWEDSNLELPANEGKASPSETQVRKGVPIVHGNKELYEKLGRNDLCPCGSCPCLRTVVADVRDEPGHETPIQDENSFREYL